MTTSLRSLIEPTATELGIPATHVSLTYGYIDEDGGGFVWTATITAVVGKAKKRGEAAPTRNYCGYNAEDPAEAMGDARREYMFWKNPESAQAARNTAGVKALLTEMAAEDPELAAKLRERGIL